MADSGWQMADGRWQIADSRWRIACRVSPVAHRAR